MKQKISIALVLAMMLALLAGWTGTTVVYSPVIESTTPAETGAPTAAPASGAVKTGLAISPSISDSVSASTDAEGEIKYDVTLAAVTVTDDGVIESCIIDSVPASVTGSWDDLLRHPPPPTPFLPRLNHAGGQSPAAGFCYLNNY